MSKLNSMTVIITGGSHGIGLSIAKCCAEAGATVIITARNTSGLKLALNSLKEISNKAHNIYPLDVSNYDQVKSFVEWVKVNYGRINGLVNCAGIFGPIGRSTEIDIIKFVEAININFLGTVYMCHAFAPLIISDTRRKIINFSGGGATSPFPNYSAYATSKVAVVKFTENLAIELESESFDVNCIAPGFVVTRLHQQTLDEGIAKVGAEHYNLTKSQIEKGGVSPAHAASLSVFLLSKESDGISGKLISAPWDPWQTEEFQNQLRSDKDFTTLRRIDNKFFMKKS